MPPSSDRASPALDTDTSRGLPGRVPAGSTAVTITIATLRDLMSESDMVMPSPCSRFPSARTAARFCAESPVRFNPTTSP